MSTAMSATVQAMKHLKIGSTVIATARKTISRSRRTQDTGHQGVRVSKPVGQVKLPDYASYKVAREPYGSIQQLTVC